MDNFAEQLMRMMSAMMHGQSGANPEAQDPPEDSQHTLPIIRRIDVAYIDVDKVCVLTKVRDEGLQDWSLGDVGDWLRTREKCALIAASHTMSHTDKGRLIKNGKIAVYTLGASLRMVKAQSEVLFASGFRTAGTKKQDSGVLRSYVPASENQLFLNESQLVDLAIRLNQVSCN